MIKCIRPSERAENCLKNRLIYNQLKYFPNGSASIESQSVTYGNASSK